MPLTLDDIPQIVEQGSKLIETIRAAIDRTGPGGKQVTKAELVEIVRACGEMIQVVAEEIAD